MVCLTELQVESNIKYALTFLWMAKTIVLKQPCKSNQLMYVIDQTKLFPDTFLRHSPSAIVETLVEGLIGRGHNYTIISPKAPI